MPKRKGTIGGRTKKVTGAKKYGLKKASTPRRAPAPMSAKKIVRKPPKAVPLGSFSKKGGRSPIPKRPPASLMVPKPRKGGKKKPPRPSRRKKSSRDY